jgi:hypothetical protein
MPARNRRQYLSLRRRYKPKKLKLIIIAESPPASGKYFYDPIGRITEPLFAALMRHVPFTPKSKDEGLRRFRRTGWLLVDATYEPVNKLKTSARNAVIDRSYKLLRRDLAVLTAGKPIPLILIKKNVCRRLEPKLKKAGFEVLNDGVEISFPSNGRQPEFHNKFRVILKGSRHVRSKASHRVGAVTKKAKG